jgi:hypothetical protein
MDIENRENRVFKRLAKDKNQCLFRNDLTLKKPEFPEAAIDRPQIRYGVRSGYV